MVQIRVRLWACLRPALWLLVFQAAAFAAEHHGRVAFNGVPVPGASVTAVHGVQQQNAVTDVQGIFEFEDLAEGLWTIRVEMQGFVAQQQQVKIDKTTSASTFDLKMLSLADVLSTAKVMAPVPAAQLQPATKKNESKQEVAEMVPPPAASDADKGEDGMLINGSENNAATSKYSISQAFGSRRPGAKGLYTGSLGTQISASPFDARPYTLTGLAVPKASYSRITGVVTLGGPLRIPPILRNGPNFFVGYQWTRDGEASTISNLVPTAAQRNGDLSNTFTANGQPVSIVDPVTGRPITGPVPISPQAQSLLALYPLPNLAGNSRYNYQTQVLTNTHADALQSRLDQGLGRRDQVYGGFGFRSIRSDDANLFHFRDVTNTLGIDTNIKWSHRFPHQILLETGYRFTRLRTQIRPYFQNKQNISGDAGITGNEQSPTNWGPPDLSFSSGIAGLEDGRSAFNRNRTDALSVEATWVHRRHTVMFGGDFRRQEFNQFSQANPRGGFTFTGAATQGSGSTGSDLADFLIGVPDASQVAYGNADKYFRQSVYDLFVNDDWRIRPELTISSGLRWDYGAPMTELKGRLVNLDIAPDFSAATQVLGSSPVGSTTGMVYPSSLVRADKRKFEPRVGIAWRPLPTVALVVRAGYGVYVDTSVYLSGAQSMAQQSPLSTSVNVSNGPDCPLTLADGFRNCPGTTANTFAIDPNFRVGYAQTWRLSVQQDLPGSLVLTAAYLGTKGTRGPQDFLPNTYPPDAAVLCTTCPRGFTYRTSNGNSIRHAGEIQLRRRLRSGLTATLDYVYAKSIDNDSMLGGMGYVSSSSSSSTSSSSSSSSSQSSGASTGPSAPSSTSSSGTIAQNWLDLQAERSRSNFDQRHLLKFSIQYTTGMGMRGSNFFTGWRASALKQWTIASQLSAGTGLPQTPIYPTTVPGTGFFGPVRPDLTGADIYSAHAGYHLNSAAYAAPVAGQWGSAGRYSIEGPGALTLDSSVARNFRLHDPLSIDVRVDATNVLNHVVYTGWNTTLNGTTFGLPADTKAMRSLQISGRFRF
ncbi:MAG TPA: carboxypeptidase regulatory-like domain-containing protein [Edaphobacter sp.]|nr:carboxypeptidase regulatory-like domain-containing protein [Edaphobacter sp.]